MSLVEAAILLATFCASLLGSRVMWGYALQRKLLDVPNVRSSHVVPTPRGGGLAIVLSFFAASSALLMLGLLDRKAMLALAGGGAIAGVGFLDDHSQVSAKWRFGVHLAAAIFVVAVLGAIRLPIFRGLGPGAYWLSALLTVFTFAWATNLFNFMDGIDGLAAGEAIFMSAGGAILNYANAGDAGLTVAMACLSAATLGFSWWNWPPARLFMGDVGSGFLGFTLTVLAFVSSQRGGVAIGAWAILGGVFLVERFIDARSQDDQGRPVVGAASDARLPAPRTALACAFTGHAVGRRHQRGLAASVGMVRCTLPRKGRILCCHRLVAVARAGFFCRFR